MSKKVLFASRRPLGRCENITAIYKAWNYVTDEVEE